ALHQTVTVDGISSKPQMVLFDPNNNLLRGLHFTKTIAELHYQARNASSVADRLWALDQLSKSTKADRSGARTAVQDVIAHDSFYGVRADAIDAATALDDAAAVRIGLHDSDPRVV